MFASLRPLPADPLLALIGACREDPRTDKIDLGVGVYRDDTGNTPVMRAVKDAEAALLRNQTTKAYIAPEGDREFTSLLANLVFGRVAPEVMGIQSVGGTGALRLGAELLRAAGCERAGLPVPTWPNHEPILAKNGIKAIHIAFYDTDTSKIDFTRFMAGLDELRSGDALLLQAACHNPLGADFSLDQWREIAQVAAARGIVPFLDFAYQGFGDGIEQDAAGMRLVVDAVPEAVVATTCSKTFGLYRDRVGALFVKSAPSERATILSNLNAISRANYSMPPDHGAAIVRLVLGDALRRMMWQSELAGMHARIAGIRRKLSGSNTASALLRGIASQKGMFSMLPLSSVQVAKLRAEHAIYMPESGRINVAGLRDADIPRFVEALAHVA